VARARAPRQVEGFEGMAPDSADFIHTVVEASKLAFADKTAYCPGPPGGLSRFRGFARFARLASRR
jgi:gamma-glutamyltranspeptidase